MCIGGVVVHTQTGHGVMSEQQMQDLVWTSQYIGMSGMHWAERERERERERDQTGPVMTAAPLGKGRFMTSQAQRLTLEGIL